MKFHLSNNPGQNIFTAHGAGYVQVNDQRYEQPVIVTPDQVIIDKQVKSIYWFYAYSLYDSGEWKDYCTPSWKVHSLNYCQNKK